MDLNNLSFGQRPDPQSGLIQPWFTHPALDEISKMDLSEKVIIQFGAGMGDAWLAKRCKHLYCVERDMEWAAFSRKISRDAGVNNIDYLLRPCNDSDGKADFYTELPPGIAFDIIINDDAYRTEVCFKAIEYFKETGGILIVDNWWQDFVWKSPVAIAALEPFRKNIHLQVDHKDHEGDPWKTAIIYFEKPSVNKKSRASAKQKVSN